MALPLWDPIDIPPGTTLVDVNSLTPASLREQMQGEVLTAWVAAQGLSWADVPPRPWADNEGAFIVYENETAVGVVIIFDVEAMSPTVRYRPIIRYFTRNTVKEEALKLALVSTDMTRRNARGQIVHEQTLLIDRDPRAGLGGLLGR